jgi:hypothetical protein
MQRHTQNSKTQQSAIFAPAAAVGLLAAEAAITKDKVTNLPGFGAPMTDTYSGCE